MNKGDKEMKEIWPFIVLFLAVLVVSFFLEFIFGLNVIVTLLAILVVAVITLNIQLYQKSNNDNS